MKLKSVFAFGIDFLPALFASVGEAVVGDLSAQFAEVALAPDPNVVKISVEDGSAALVRDL